MTPDDDIFAPDPPAPPSADKVATLASYDPTRPMPGEEAAGVSLAAAKVVQWLADTPWASWHTPALRTWAKEHGWPVGTKWYQDVLAEARRLIVAAHSESLRECAARLVSTSERIREQAMMAGELAVAAACVKIQSDILLPKRAEVALIGEDTSGRITKERLASTPSDVLRRVLEARRAESGA